MTRDLVLPALGGPIVEIDLEQLHLRLERDAERAGSLDVAYTTVDSPLGELLLAATLRGLVRVAFAVENHEAVLTSLAQRVSPRILRAPRPLDGACRQLDEYFAARRRRFDLPLDFALSHGFRERVQRVLPQIGFGATRSYREVAADVGAPHAVRAVGSACATNPLPIVVPCHRVLRSDGSLGGYLGGLDAKAALLRLEATASAG